MSNYRKVLVSLATAVLLALQPLLGQQWDRAQWLTLAVAVLGAFTVYVAPNESGSVAEYSKAVVAALTAGAEAALHLVGPVTSQGWLTIALAVLGALGVTAARNEKTPPQLV